MRGIAQAAFGLIAAAALASAASDVHDLKADSFASFVTKHDIVLAEFFAPWCGHCKALAPEYEEAATTLKEKGIALAKVDCTEEADLCQQYGVEGYPTLKVFRGPDDVQAYGGQRKAPAIISYMTKQSLPAVSSVTPQMLEEFKSADQVVVVAYFDAKDTASNATYSALASTFRDSYLFGATNDVALATAEGVKQPAIVLYKQFDEGKNVFDQPFEASAIEQFVKTASTPLIGEVGPETYAGYMAAGIPLAYIFAETPEERASLAATLRSVAEEHKGKVNFATIDAKAFGQHAANLNLDVGSWPAFAIQETTKNLKYPFDQTKTLTEAEIGSFVQSYLAGEVKPSVKSEPIPEKQDGGVTVIVAHTYDAIVNDETKDVLVEFYAPWCGHCKTLAPKYEELGALFAPFAKHVTIAKVDATANDVPEEIQGFPTIKLYPAGSKNKTPIDYSGPRDVESLAGFVQHQGKNAVDPNAQPDSDDEMLDAPSVGASVTEEMQHQAPAATKVVSGAAAAVTDAVKQAAAAVVELDDGGLDEHDEL